jgi:hypothetical protein
VGNAINEKRSAEKVTEQATARLITGAAPQSSGARFSLISQQYESS